MEETGVKLLIARGKNNTNKLVPSTLENALSGSGLYLKHTGWASKVKENGLFVDLSRIEWADLNALVRLTLLVENALKNNIRVRVAMPLVSARVKEEAFIKSCQDDNTSRTADKVLARIERRAKTLLFMKYVDFHEAILCPHIPHASSLVSLDYKYDIHLEVAEAKSSVDAGVPDDSETSLEAPISDYDKTYQTVFPMRWVQCVEEPQLEPFTDSLRRFLTGIVSNKRRGISSLDAQALINVLFYEIMLNVRQHSAHSGEPYCLVAAWCWNFKQPIISSEFLKKEQHFFRDWIEANQLPLVDISIGDSGLGIPTVLGKAFDHAGSNKKLVPDEAQTREEQITFWSLDRWSSSKDTSALRGTRGLHRVHRLVKAYQGLLTLRTDTVLAGWDTGGNDLHNPVNARGLACVPGTFISIRMPAYTTDSKFYSSRPVVSKTVKYHLTGLHDLGKAQGSIDKDFIRKIFASRENNKHSCLLCVVTGVPEPLAEMKEFIETLLANASELANPGAIVLLFPQLNEQSLSNYVNSVNEIRERDGLGRIDTSTEHHQIQDPILILDRVGQPLWCGVSEFEEKILNHLLSSEEAMITPEQISKYLPNEQTFFRVKNSLRQQTDILRETKDGNFALRFNVSNILEKVKSNASIVASTLRNLLESGQKEDGVLRGRMMSPSLAVVSKWIDANTFLQSIARTKEGIVLPARACSDDADDDLCLSINSHIILYALSLRVNDYLSEIGKRPNVVFGDAFAHKYSMENLASFQGAKEAIILPTGNEAEKDADVWDIVDKQKVVVYTDALLTTNSVRQMLGHVFRNGAEPLAVACLIDARQPSETDKPLNWFGRDVNVVSMISHSFYDDSDKSTSYRYISPVVSGSYENSVDNEYQGVLDRRYKLPPEQLKTWLKSAGAIWFTHIVRPMGRHFTFYISISKMLRSTNVSVSPLSVLTEALYSELEDWAQHLSDVTAFNEFEIFYRSGDKDDQAGVFAASLHRRIGLEKMSQIRPLLRTFVNGTWNYPPSIPAAAKHVVIIDWGAVTGRTLTNLIRIAAQSGAKSVLALICISQLQADEEDFLYTLEKISVPMSMPSDLFDTQTTMRSVSIRIRFISSAHIPAYGVNTCPICHQAQRLRLESDKYPSEQLRRFAREMQKELRPRSSEVIKDEQKVSDIYGVTLSGDDVVFMWSFRKDLETAIRSTIKRHRIYSYIYDVINEMNNGKVEAYVSARRIVCLLATELQWIKLPPLRLEVLRTQLAQISLLLLRDDGEEGELRQAIVVLRSSSKYHFAKHFKELAGRFYAKPLVFKQLLYDAYTFLKRTYHHRSELIQPLIDGLEYCEVQLLSGSIYKDTDFEEISSLVHTLRSLGEKRLGLEETSWIKPPRAWNVLKDYYQTQFKVHDLIPTEVMTLHDASLEEYQEEMEEYIGTTESWQSKQHAWKKIRPFLERRVLANIHRFLDVVKGPFLQTISDDGDLERLEAMCLEENTDDLQWMSNLIEQFEKKPPHAKDLEWHQFKELRRWITQMFLAPRTPQDEDECAWIIQVLEGCPADLYSVVEGCRNNQTLDKQSKIHIQCEIEDTRVFCHEELVKIAVNEVLKNALVDHVRPTNSHNVEVWIKIREAREWLGMIIMDIENTGSDSSYRRNKKVQPKGLETLNNQMTPYGCDLSWDEKTDGVFHVEFHFPKGD